LKFFIRGVVTRFVTVETASRKHKVNLDELLAALNQAIKTKAELIEE
jgi:translation initiation factor 2 gamma subunit (eIF-2gamma)